MNITYNAAKQSLELVLGKRKTVTLSPEDTQRLVRDVASLTDQFRQAKPLVGPFVLTISLPYSDVDNDQTTPGYTVAVRSDSLEMLQEVQPLIDEEVMLAGFFTKAAIPVIPEEDFVVRNLTSMKHASDVLTEVRAAMLLHQSDSIIEGGAERYWKAMGFKPSIYGGFDDLLEGFTVDLSGAEDFTSESFGEYVDSLDLPPRERKRLKWWGMGRPIAEVKAVGL